MYLPRVYISKWRHVGILLYFTATPRRLTRANISERSEFDCIMTCIDDVTCINDITRATKRGEELSRSAP